MALSEKEVRKQISINIKRLREKRGITQERLAEQIHRSNKSVYQYEHGDKCPSVPILALIAETLNVTVDSLIFGDNLSSEIKEISKTLSSFNTNELTILNNILWHYASERDENNNGDINYVMLVCKLLQIFI